MGLSNIIPGADKAGDGGGGAAPTTGDAAAPAHKSFGDKLGDYFQSKYPIAGGLAGMVFGNNQVPPAATPPAGGTGPTDPGMSMPDYSNVVMANAQPQQGGGGLAALLKILA